MSKFGKELLESLAQAVEHAEQHAQPRSRAKSKPKVAINYTLGRDAWAAICAVDGLRLTDEMQRDFAEYDRLQLSPDERRKAIFAKYAKGR